MNKLTIPTILVATVMVAGIFAFMPVQQASTVHTTIGGLNVATADDQIIGGGSADLVILADSATIKDGILCASTVDANTNDVNTIEVDVTADGDSLILLDNAAIEGVGACELFSGFSINMDAAGTDATDFLDFSIAFTEVTP